MSYYKPQLPLKIGDNFYYPLTTYDQIIKKDGTRVTEIADGKNIPRLYSATFTANGWNGDSAPYTQTVTITPLYGGQPVTSQSVFASSPMCEKTTVKETNKTLQKILNLFNTGYSQLGDGNVVSYLFEKPTSDITIIWSIKEG